MRRGFRGRKTKQDEIEALNAAHRFWGALGTKEKSREIAESFCRPVPEAKTRVNRPNDPDKPLEKDVLARVLAALRSDRRVALVERTQSGVFQEGNRYVRVGTPGKLDITGMLVGGKYFEIECKRPGLRPDERQAERIATIKANGGIAGCATSAAEALAILP